MINAVVHEEDAPAGTNGSCGSTLCRSSFAIPMLPGQTRVVPVSAFMSTSGTIAVMA